MEGGGGRGGKGGEKPGAAPPLACRRPRSRSRAHARARPARRSFHAGHLSVNFSSNYYLLSQRHDDVPRLTPAHLEVRRWPGHAWHAAPPAATGGACKRWPWSPLPASLPSP